MIWLFLVVTAVAVVSMSAQGILIKRFDDVRPGAEITYTFLSAVFAFVLFSVIALVSKSQFNPDSVLYSFLFAFCYAGSTVTYVLAVGCGSLAITATVHSFALIIPTVFGMVVWNEDIGALKVCGIAFLVASLLLVGEKAGEGEKNISKKWLIIMCISFLCEGFAPVALTAHERAVGAETAASCEGTLMVMAYAMAALGIFVAALVREGKKTVTVVTKSGEQKRNLMLEGLKIALPLASLGGVANALQNSMYNIADGRFGVSVYLPVVSAAQVVLTCVLAVVLFKEKLAKKQYFAIVCGIAAIVLLNV